MRLLVLGGSWSLGRLIIDDCVRRGFDVTVFNRGRHRSAARDGVRQLGGDRQRAEDLRSLASSGPWDTVIDISGKIPAMVRNSVRALQDVTERYVSVSTVLVYRPRPGAAVDEDSPVWDGDPDFEPESRSWDPDTYGSWKVGCEMACRRGFGDDRVLILRLDTILGQREDADPLRWWLNRVQRGGDVLVSAPHQAMQGVDMRDVSRFIVHQVDRGTCGVFNVATSPEERTLKALTQTCAQVVGSAARARPEFLWVNEDWLLAQGVRQLTEIPLWNGVAAPEGFRVDRAVAAGLRCRPLLETVVDTWHAMRSTEKNLDPRRSARYGLDPSREAEIIARWRARLAGSAGSRA